MSEIESLFSRKDMTFDEAVSYFKDRVPVPSAIFYTLAEKYRGLAFTVSGYTSAQVLKKFYEEILSALEDGITLEQFKANMEDFLEANGYEGLDPAQADNIFRTNIQTAYNAGHYAQLTDPTVMRLRPYWIYDAIEDDHTRPSHLAMDGMVYPADSPVWDTWFPPNGFRCRCTVRSLSKRQLEARGLTVSTAAPSTITPDPSFATNPAKTRFNPDMKGYPAAIAKAYRDREKDNPQK